VLLPKAKLPKAVAVIPGLTVMVYGNVIDGTIGGTAVDAIVMVPE